MKWYFQYLLITILLMPTPGFTQTDQQIVYLVEDYSLLPFPQGKSLISSQESNFLEPEKEYIDRDLLLLGSTFSGFENGSLNPWFVESLSIHPVIKSYGMGLHFVNDIYQRYGGVKFMTPYADFNLGMVEPGYSPYLTLDFFPQGTLGLIKDEDSLRWGGVLPWNLFWDSGSLEILFQWDQSSGILNTLDYLSEIECTLFPWYPWQGRLSGLLTPGLVGSGLQGSWNRDNLVLGAGLGVWSEDEKNFSFYPEFIFQINPGFFSFISVWGVSSGPSSYEPLVWKKGLFPWTVKSKYVPRGSNSLSWEGEFLKLTGEVQSSSDNFDRLPFDEFYGRVSVSTRYGEMGAFSKFEGTPGFYVSTLFPLIPWFKAVGIKVKYSPWDSLLKTEGELQSSWGNFLINTDQSSFGISWSMEW